MCLDEPWLQTVEINNTDAEGRLVLGDGVVSMRELPAETVVLIPLLQAHAAKNLNAQVIIDIATLTGAQVTKPMIKYLEKAGH